MRSGKVVMQVAHFVGIGQNEAIWLWAWSSNILFLLACALNEEGRLVTSNGVIGLCLFVAGTKLFLIHQKYAEGKEAMEKIDVIYSPFWRLFTLLSWSLVTVETNQFPIASWAVFFFPRGYLIYLMANYNVTSGTKARELITSWLNNVKRKFTIPPAPARQPSPCVAP